MMILVIEEMRGTTPAIVLALVMSLAFLPKMSQQVIKVETPLWWMWHLDR
jgi:hypothetical protein